MTKSTVLVLFLIAVLFNGCTRDNIGAHGEESENRQPAGEEQLAGPALDEVPSHDRPVLDLADPYRGLIDNEVLEVRVRDVSRRDSGWEYVLSLHATTTQGTIDRELGTITTFTVGLPGVTAREYLFFRVLRDNGDGRNAELWRFDGTTGEITDLGLTVGSSMAVSNDGTQLCYVRDEYPREFGESYGPPRNLYIPVLYLQSFAANTSLRYDFSDTFLEDRWGVATSIEYESDTGVFRIAWSQDAPGNRGSGILDPSTGEFEFIPYSE